MQVRRARLTAANLAWMGELKLNPSDPTVKIQFEFVRIKKPKPAKFEFLNQEASAKIKKELEFAQRKAHSLTE